MISDKEMDRKMKSKGYAYKLIPKSGKFDPLYIKHAMDAGPLLWNQYPNETFDVKILGEFV